MPDGLLRSRCFLPLFLAQALGALNDNLFKTALAVLVVFRDADSGAALAAAAGGVFILPFALLSATAGQLADRFDKARLIRLSKLAEFLLMLAGAAGFATGSTVLLFSVLFGLGVQAAFFGPLKYGILPDLLNAAELLPANALIEAATFLAILLGTIAGGVLVLRPAGPSIVACASVALALAGLLAARRIPPTHPAAPGLGIGWNIVSGTWRVLRDAYANRVVWCAILGLSWFWTLGAVFLAAFPVLVRERLGAGGAVVTVMLAAFVLGIGAGSALAGRLGRGAVSARRVVPAMLLLACFAADFAWVAAGITPQAGWHDPAAMLAVPRAWRLLGDLVLMALCGGVFSVPLYAVIQARSDPARRARMVAANNIVNAAMMVAGAAVQGALAAVGLGAPAILAIAAAADLAAALMLWRAMRAMS